MSEITAKEFEKALQPLTEVLEKHWQLGEKHLGIHNKNANTLEKLADAVTVLAERQKEISQTVDMLLNAMLVFKGEVCAAISGADEVLSGPEGIN